MADSPVSTSLAIFPTNAIQTEGNRGTKPFTFTVTRSGNTAGVNALNWAVTGSGTSPANEITKVITVNVQGDTTVELDEGFTVVPVPLLLFRLYIPS